MNLSLFAAPVPPIDLGCGRWRLPSETLYVTDEPDDAHIARQLEALAETVRAETELRRFYRHMVARVHSDERWRIGSPEAQRAAVQWARLLHSQSAARQRADVAAVRRLVLELS